MKKKIAAAVSVLIIACATAAVCLNSPKGEIDGLLESPQKYIKRSIALYGVFKEGAFDDVTVPGTLDEFTDSCDAAARVEVVGSAELNEISDEFICRVEKDYFKNLNYFGNKSGYITLTADKGRYEVGRRYYLFMSAYADYSLHSPYIVYTDEDYYLRVQLNDDGTLSFIPKAEGLANSYYSGLVETLDMDKYLKDFASKRSKAEIESPARYSSYEEALEKSASAVRIKVTDRIYWGKYSDKIMIDIVEVLMQGENYELGEDKIIPNYAECEPGREYVMLLSEDNYIISPEYTVMSVGKYEELAK